MNTTTVNDVNSPESIPATQRGLEAEPMHIRFERNSDQIGLLTFDRAQSVANVFDRQTLEQLDAHITMLGHDTELRGLVMVSAKPSIFIAGADLHSLSHAAPDDVRSLIELGQQVFGRVAALAQRIPVVAAIHGACVGGGYELALACRYRVASSDKSTRIGLPEVQLGILPAWGGSTRLPRLVGVPKALDIILAGKTLPAVAALKSRLVEEVVPAELLVDHALRRIREKGSSLQPPPLPISIQVMAHQPLLGLAVRKAGRAVLKKTHGLYPAQHQALRVIAETFRGTIAESLQREREGVLSLLHTPECRRLVELFFLQERARKFQYLAGNDPVIASRVEPLGRAFVLGAGVMGSGIAHWMSSKGITTILRDLNTECLARGMGNIRKLLEDSVKRKSSTAVEARMAMDRVIPVTQDVPLQRMDLVVEAAVEKMSVKKEIFRHLAQVTGPQTILATNTSALSIAELADATSAPERVLGIHFFNPVHRMQLVEVVVGPRTDPHHVRRAVQWVQKMGKLPVVVKDRPGFLVNRILMPYLMEAGRLFQEGVSVADLDASMIEFGMPMGPMRLLDEVGLDVAMHVAETLVQGLPLTGTIPPVFQEMIAEGWLGKKSGRGFYVYDSSHSAEERAHPKVVALQRGTTALDLDHEGIRDRLVLAMINEAMRCLEEGIVADAGDVDFAMVMGTGFAPFRGGPLRHAESLGLTHVLNSLRKLASPETPQFEPSLLLIEKASAGQGLYPADSKGAMV